MKNVARRTAALTLLTLVPAAHAAAQRAPAASADRPLRFGVAGGVVIPRTGSQARARAIWAFAHGMVMLELDHRFPPDADLDAAWRSGITAFQPA